MSNFFLYNEAIDVNNYDQFLLGMSELIAIDKEKEDFFYRHESIYNINIIDQFYSNLNESSEKAILMFIEQLVGYEKYISTEIIFQDLFPAEANAFLGIDFSSTVIDPKNQIIDNSTYKLFNKNELWNVDFKDLWSKRVKLFPNLILCGAVEKQFTNLGRASTFKQIVQKLFIFNNAINDWTQGDLNINAIKQQYPLDISGESTRTMAKFGKERIFSLPQGGTKIFELHIKTGVFRFHFFPDNATRKVYVGYIGTHLSTVNN